MRELRAEIKALESVKNPDYFHIAAKQRRLKLLDELKKQFIFKIFDADNP